MRDQAPLEDRPRSKVPRTRCAPGKQSLPPKDKELAPSCNHPKSVTIADGLSLRLGEALADPILRALMAADGVEPASVETLMRRMTSGVSGRPSWT